MIFFVRFKVSPQPGVNPAAEELGEAFANFWVSADSPQEAKSEASKILGLEGWSITSLEANRLDHRREGRDGAEPRSRGDLIKEMPSKEPYVIHHVYLKH
jgi:hypothetical protein